MRWSRTVQPSALEEYGCGGAIREMESLEIKGDSFALRSFVRVQCALTRRWMNSNDHSLTPCDATWTIARVRKLGTLCRPQSTASTGIWNVGLAKWPAADLWEAILQTGCRV